MTRTTHLTLVAAAVLGLAACGSDGGDDATDATDATVDAMPNPMAVVPEDAPAPSSGPGAMADDGLVDDGPAAEGPATDEPAAGGTGGTTTAGDDVATADDTPAAPPVEAGDDIDLTDASPRVITSACGTLPVSDAAAGTSLAAPGTLVEGRLARGRIDPDFAGNETHYWRIDLQPGYHHLVVDTRRLDGRDSNLGLEINDVDAAGDSDERLLFGNERGFETRLVEFFVNSEPRTLTLEVTPNFAAEDYVIGVLANGRSVPSPRFEGCPDATPTSVGTTAALRLDDPDGAEDLAWYRIDLEERGYLIDAVASRADGRDSNIAYEVVALDGFGDAATEDRILFVNDRGTVSTDDDAFERSAAGPVWLRFEALVSDLDVEFTVLSDGE